MKFLKKLKSGNFWVSLISAGVLIAEVIFDFELKTEYLNQILLGLMGLMTLFGIVSDHGSDSVVLQSSNSSNKTETDASTSNANISNIKSICDTISLLLNKVSFTHDNEEDVKIEEVEKKEGVKEDNIQQETALEEKEVAENSENLLNIEENQSKEDNLKIENETQANSQNETKQNQIVIRSIVN